MRRLLLLGFALVAAFVALTPVPASAQNDMMQVIRRDYEKRRGQIEGGPGADRGPVQGLIDLFRFGGRRAEPAPPMAVPDKPRTAKRVSPLAAPKPKVDPADIKPEVPPSVFVHVIGDSLAEMLADGLEAQLADRTDIAVVPHTRSSSGFVRTDYHDWNGAVSELLAGPDKIDAAVIMLGANDRQQIKENGEALEVRSDGWRSAYVRRIDALLAQLKAKGIKTFWVGLPPMKNARLTADVVWFNEIYRDRVEAAGGTYVDIWDGFVDVDGAYTATGPDLNGQVAKLRAGDGVHFSKAGALLAAHYVERDLRRALGDAPIAATPSATVSLGLPVPDEALGGAQPGAPAEKPEFGPVMPLDAVETSEGSALLGGGLPAGPSQVASTVPIAAPAGFGPAADPSAAKVLLRGEPLASKDGRADDFRWPRPSASPDPMKTSSVPVPQTAR